MIRLTVEKSPITLIQQDNNKKVNISESINPILLKLGALFDDSKTSDVVFTVEGQKIHAHRQHLSMMSPNLTELLSDHRGKSKQKLDVTECGYSTFYVFIQYFYTGIVPVQSMTTLELIDLLDLATDLVEEPIRQECVKEMHSKMCIEHACITYQTAVKYRFNDLKKEAANFIRTNLKAVTKTEAYKKLNQKTSKMLLTSMAKCS